MTNDDASFYRVLGPFLARREVHNVIGCPPWDDDGKLWFIAYRGENVAGFAAVLVESDRAVLCSDYTPDVVIRELLLRERLKWAKGKKIAVATAVVSSPDRGVYKRFGFEIVKELKNFAQVRKELKWASV